MFGRVAPVHHFLYELAQDMADCDVRFLNVLRAVAWHDYSDVHQLGEGAAPATEKSYRKNLLVLGTDNGADDVLGVAACASANQHVTGSAQRIDQPFENSFEATVIRPRCEKRCISAQSDGWDPRTLHRRTETARELGGDVLGVSRASAIAAQHDFAAGGHQVGGSSRGFDYRRPSLIGKPAFHCRAVQQMLPG
jgi:hypothetical protein